MGIKGLAKLLAEHAPEAARRRSIRDYRGRAIAIDATMSIYQFLIVVGRNGTQLLTNHAGEVTSHLQGMFSRTVRLLEAGIKPVYVFDGPPPSLKGKELEKRLRKRENAEKDLSAALEEKSVESNEAIEKFSKRMVKVTEKHVDECIRLLNLMGVPTVEAPSEAEAQCAVLCRTNQVYAVASEDMDTLTFGTLRFLRHLMDPNISKTPIVEFELPEVLNHLELTMDQFIDLCILSGCDYCEFIKGIGGQRALKLIRQHGCIEEVLKNINKERYHVPEDWAYLGARNLFREPDVYHELPEISWTLPDEKGLLNFLVAENNFKEDRVTKMLRKMEASRDTFQGGRIEVPAKSVDPCAPKIKKVRCAVTPTQALTSRTFSTAAPWQRSLNYTRLQLA